MCCLHDLYLFQQFLNSDIFSGRQKCSCLLLVSDLKFDYKNVATSCRRHVNQIKYQVCKSVFVLREAQSGREYQDGLMFSVNDWNTNKVELNTEEVQAKELLFVRKKTKYLRITHMQIWNKINRSVTL